MIQMSTKFHVKHAGTKIYWEKKILYVFLECRLKDDWNRVHGIDIRMWC